MHLHIDKTLMTRKQTNSIFLLTALISIMSLLPFHVLSGEITSIGAQCNEIGYMPQQEFMTFAKDSSEDLVDIHTFNKYFTFQIDRPLKQREREIETVFYTPKSGDHGFVFRLKAELSSSFSDEVQQGMRVTLLDKEQGSILIDGSSIDGNEGSVKLDYEQLEEETAYVLKYEFFDRQIIRNQDLPEVSFSASNTECKMPFITQELLILDQRIVQRRINGWKAELEDKDDQSRYDVKDFRCDFGRLNNSQDQAFGEDGLYCERREYYYSLPTKSVDLVKIYEQDFQIRGDNNELITYWLDFTLGYNFMLGAGIKVLLSRQEENSARKVYDRDLSDNALSCLYDKSCIVSHMSNKNEMRIEVILTSGKYKLTIFDSQEMEMREFMREEMGVNQIPFTFKAMSWPVVQNEDRDGCPYMFIQSDFIQNKFIEGRQGQRFTFEDKIIMNIFNLSQMIDIKPETDSLIKVKVKETFGVNTELILYQKNTEILRSNKVGSTSMLFGKLSKGVAYTLELSYKNSIIEFSDFFSCPHLNLELSLIPEVKAKALVKSQECTHAENWEAEEKLISIFNSLIDNTEGYEFLDEEFIFKSNVSQSGNEDKTQNYAINSYLFTVKSKMQLFVEIFYDAYLYDIELYLSSIEQSLVREHIYQDVPHVDWSLYKGAKSLFVELEPGEYEIKLLQKLPALPDSAYSEYFPSCVQFQMNLHYNKTISKQQASVPPTFNYYGLLGPTGSNFGQMIYFCDECVMENQREQEIYFRIEGGRSAFSALIQSQGNAVGIMLLEVSEPDLSKTSHHKYDQETNEDKRVGLKSRKTIGDDGHEEVIQDSEIAALTLYKLVIINKDFSKYQAATFTLRIEITEKSYKSDLKRFSEKLPASIHEIKRDKLKAPGMKESEFLVGSKYMLQFMNEQALYPFIPKSTEIYQSKYKASADSNHKTFKHALPFKVNEEAVIHASIFDFTGVANLGLSIYRKASEGDTDDDESGLIVTSIPGKYHSYIEPISLTKGDYVFVIAPDQPYVDDKEDSVLRFSLDFVRQRENVTDGFDEAIMESMELCGLPEFPEGLNSPQFIHALNGHGMEFFSEYKISELVMGSNLRFTIDQTSLVIFYMEIPKEIQGTVELFKTKGTYRVKAVTDDLNSQNDNFLRQKDLTHQNVIEFREYMNAGQYDIQLHAVEQIGGIFYAMPRCQTFKVGMSVIPTMKAKYSITEKCYETTAMETNLRFDQRVQGNLTYDISQQIFDTSYISTSDQGEGPFILYFHINYDSSLEGPLALVLSKYSTEDLTFSEIALYEVQNSYSQMISIIDEGTYVVSIQSLSSMPKKYGTRGLGKSTDVREKSILRTPCLQISYTYYIASLNANDNLIQEYDLIDVLAALFSGNMDYFSMEDDSNEEQKLYDYQVREEITDLDSMTCKYDKIPHHFPVSETGFDISYTFPIGQKNYDIIDLVSETNQLLRVFLKSRSPKSNVNAFLYDGADYKNLLVSTENSKSSNEFMINLKPQEKSFKLKIVYDTIDEQATCPVYDLRIALKPIANLVEEELKCTGLPTPPEEIKFKDGSFDLDEEYAISSGFIDKFQMQREITYDIEITAAPRSDKKYEFHFDIETRFIFLISNIDMELFAKDNTGEMISMGQSKWFNEDQIDYSDSKAEILSQKDFVNRLRVTTSNEDLGEGLTLSSAYLLRLKFSRQMQKLTSYLTKSELATRDNPICFPFDLSIRIIEPKYASSKTQNKKQVELVRVEWPQRLTNELFDNRKKLTGFLEFDEPIQDIYKKMKFQSVVYLFDEKQQANDYSHRIYPSNIRLSVIDKTTLIITFKHNSLTKGTCYQLKFEKGSNYLINQDLLANQTRLCTSNCLCNEKGTKECKESKGICVCHYPFTGKDCSECEKGHVFDPLTQDCVVQRKCVASGGSENCSNHGVCSEDPKTGQARCQCDLGFAHDGYSLCSKCSDPLFSYPDCVVRNWVLEDSDINCKGLPVDMPEDLYNSTKVQSEDLMVYQNEEGLCTWAGRYKLLSHGAQKSESTHNFIVPQESVFRLFLDTLKSGAKFSYQVLDASRKIVYKSSSSQGKIYSKFDQSMLILQKPTHHDPQESPFTLEIEYEYEKSSKDHNWCPMMEVFMIVQPFHKIQSYLRCTKQEIANAQQIKQFSWRFGSTSDYFNEKFTLSSDMMDDKNKNNAVYISDESENFLMLQYQLKIEKDGNALSIITSYNFASVMLSLTLIHSSSGNIIAVEKVSSLEDIQTNGEDISLDNDMASYIEVPALDKGSYELQILVRKSLFLPTSSYLTCLSFDLTIEYTVRSSQQSSVIISKTKDDEGEEVDETEEQYEILSVFPPIMKNIKQSLKKKIDVQVSRQVDLDIMIGNQNDLHHICYLKNENPSIVAMIYPYQIMITKKDTLTLYFNFMRANIPDNDTCYNLVCTTEFTVGYELFKPSELSTQYCFASKASFVEAPEVECNPNSLSKVVDGKCVCTYPYKGDLCEQCEKSYLKKTYNGHTECILDESQCSEEICNGHGQCIKSPKKADKNEVICKCKDSYDGKYCERCRNSTLQYPECLLAVGEDVYDETLEKEYLHRRQYNKDGYDKSRKVKKQEQCPFNTYPTQLDTVEFMEFLGGSFHIADYFTVNHDQDNIIEMTPQKTGVLKIFIQEPEDVEVIVNDETFDLEIAIQDKKSHKFLATSINHHVNFGSDVNGKMEYAYLLYEVPAPYLNHTLLIMFRAVNFSVTANDELSNCEMLYLEIEFADAVRECQYNPLPPSEKEIIKVSQELPYVTDNNTAYYSVQGEKKQFIFYQDFYMGAGDESVDVDADDSDYEITISVQQKFMETNFVDFALEILQNDVDYSEIQNYKSKYQKPYCKGVCLISGQKAYNEIHNIIQMDTRTYFRLWLFQSELDGSCANFQLFIQANKVNNKLSSASKFRCEELDLPISLNTERYLGGSGSQQQQDFHVLERFRVDNIRNTSRGHSMRFVLTEPTMVRFSAPVHKHIEFDIELRESYFKDGRQQARKLVISAAKDFEDTIFAQLDSGTYYLRLIFVSPEFYLSQPCQSVQLEIAMATISNIKADLTRGKDFGKGFTEFAFEKVLGNEDRMMKVQKKGVIRTQEISQESTDFESFVKLFEDRFTLPDKEGMGIMVFIQSHFLLNDVNFAVTHLESGTIFHNLKRESVNKLILENMPAGTFELLIYAHNCLTNLRPREGTYIESMDLSYTIDLNILRWTTSVDDLQAKYMILKVGDHPMKKLRAPLDSLHPLELRCHAENMILPEVIEGGVDLVAGVDIDNFYMINQIGYYEHSIRYRAGKGQDYLRILIDRANTKVRLQKQDKKLEETKSYKINGGEVNVLLSTAVEEGVDYIIFIEFGEIDNTYELESSDQFCQSFKMQIKSSSSSKECHSEQAVYDEALPIQYLQSDSDLKQISIGMNKKNRIVQTINIGDQIKNNSRQSDLEVIVDHSSLFFIQAVNLYITSAPDNKNGVSEYMRVAENEVKPVEIMDDIKNLVKYRFKSLAPYTRYDIVITVLKKPTACSCYFQLTLSTRSPLDQSTLLDRDYMGILQQYVSSTQIQDLNRYVETLPITLDTYKYLHGEDFILVSEYLQLSAGSSDQNKIAFTIPNNKTLFRMYVEHGDILLKLSELTSKTSIQDRKTNSLWGMLNEGKYEVEFDFFTELIKDQVLFKQDKIHVTIMIAQQGMYEDTYQEFQGKRIKHCEKNKNFPLALNKETSKMHGENDAVYSYPFIRLSQDVLFSQYIIDTYSFRLNETSRFQIVLGMHFLTSHLTLTLSDYHSFGQQYLGKQLFNENQIDVILSPGDYALAIGQPSLFDNPSYSLDKEESNKIECGLYSFKAHIQPLSNIQQDMLQTQVNTLSKCPINEVAPMKIYSDESETKGGGEYFINSEGTFFKMFEGVLYRKSEVSTVNPEFDRVLIESKEDSVLAVMMQFKQKGNAPVIKLHDSFGFDRYEDPLSVRDNEASGRMMELSVLFKVQKGHSYTLFIYYGGEISFDQDGSEVCEYYNLYLAINHVNFLQNEFKCAAQNKDSEILNLNKDLPRKITDLDFDGDRLYRFKHFMELKYPSDYEALKQVKNPNMIYKGIDLSVSATYDMRAQIHADFPDLFFGIGVVEQVQQDDKSQIFEDISEQLPLFPLSGKVYEPTLSRQIKGSKIDPNKKVSLVFIDEQSKPLLDYISARTQSASVEMCLYFELHIALKLQDSPAVLLAAPQIVAISPETHSREPFSLSQTQSQISIGLQLSATPYSRKSQQNSQIEKVSLAQLQDLVTLKFYNPSSSDDALYFKKAVKITKDKQGLFFTFIFDIADEQRKDRDSLLNAILNIELESLVNEKGTQFEIMKKIKVPKFSFQIEEDEKTKKKEAEENESEIHQKKNEITEKNKDKDVVQEEVKCQCVHGKCNKGSSKCSKCDAGWEGTLCDVKKDAKNINKDNGRIGSKMKRVKDASDDDAKIWAVHDAEVKGDTVQIENKKQPVQQYYIVSLVSTAGEEIYSFFASLFTFLFEVIVALVCLALAYVIGKYIYENKAFGRPYMSLPQDENEFNSPSKAMELAELNPSRSQQEKSSKGKTKAPKQKEEHKYEQMAMEEDEFSTQKLSKELMLYSDISEQDQAQMYSSISPNQEKRRFDEEQPQQMNEVDTANEIDDVLKEMSYDDDEGEGDEGDEDENRKLF